MDMRPSSLKYELGGKHVFVGWGILLDPIGFLLVLNSDMV